MLCNSCNRPFLRGQQLVSRYRVANADVIFANFFSSILGFSTFHDKTEP